MLPRNLYMKYYLLCVGAVALDQITKLWVRNNMYVGKSIPVLGNFFQITYIQNTGAAFSILQNQRFLLLVIPLLVIIFTLWYLHKHTDIHGSAKAAAALIIGGGIGNLIDRFFFAKVTDMFSFSIFPPIFNVADIAVTAGCVLLFIYVLFGEKFKYGERK